MWKKSVLSGKKPNNMIQIKFHRCHFEINLQHFNTRLAYIMNNDWMKGNMNSMESQDKTLFENYFKETLRSDIAQVHIDL